MNTSYRQVSTLRPRLRLLKSTTVHKGLTRGFSNEGNYSCRRLSCKTKYTTKRSPHVGSRDPLKFPVVTLQSLIYG